MIKTPEQAAAIHAKIAELERQGVTPPRLSRDTKIYGSPPGAEVAAAQELINGLTTLLQEANNDVIRMQASLRKKKNPGNMTYVPGHEVPRATPAEISSAEDALLAQTMRRDALDEAVRAAKDGTKLPADAGAIMDRIEAEANQDLMETADRASNGLATPDQVEHFRKRLGMVRRLRAMIL